MMDPTHQELIEAWLRATDADVSQALTALADYPADVQGLIQQEAARRGVIADCTSTELELPGSFLLRAFLLAARFLWRHRLLLSLLSGFCIRAIFSKLPPIAPKQRNTAIALFFIINAPVVIVPLAVLSKPLRPTGESSP